MRPGPTRVETYCSKLLLKVPRWRRSKLNTAGSSVTPPSAALVTLEEMPAACASAEMFCTKALKSPPQRAANEGVERRTETGSSMEAEARARRTLFMTKHFLISGKPAEAVACSLPPFCRKINMASFRSPIVRRPPVRQVFIWLAPHRPEFLPHAEERGTRPRSTEAAHPPIFRDAAPGAAPQDEGMRRGAALRIKRSIIQEAPQLP